MKKNNNSTIYDVSEKAGVSVKTVSRVINKDPSVKAVNVEKVNNAIAQLNFKPDLNARRLRSKQSNLIILLYMEYSGNFYSELVISGAVEMCDQLGYDLILRPVTYQNRLQAIELVRHVIERSSPDGFVLIPPYSDNAEVQDLLTEYKKPFVTISSKSRNSFKNIGCDEVKAAYDATSHLISLGHSRIGIINYLLNHAAGEWRRKGYLKAHADAGITVDRTLVVERKFNISQVENDVRKLLQRDAPPSGIFAVNDFLAGTVFRVASQLKLRIPHDISVVGFDDDPGAQFLWPPLTTIRQPVRELGREAVAKLVKGVIKKQTLPIPSLLPCEFVLRNSTGPYFS